MSGPGGYPTSQNQQMYHQSMPRTMSGGQLNTMMTHSGMMMSSSQQHMMNPQSGAMVSQQGYPQGMMNTGQPPPQMMAVMSSQSHMMSMGQPMMSNSHMGSAQGMAQQQHIAIVTSQHQQQMGPSPQQMQMSSQQSFIQHQQQPMSSSQSMFAVGGQPRSPAIVGGQLSQAMYHQSMPRTMSGGQLNTMMTHSGMMMSSSQQHMMNPQSGAMVSQQGYPQGMMNTGQPPPQMMAVMSSQSHMMSMGQPMMSNSHMGSAQGMAQQQHIAIVTSQHQQQMGPSPQQMQMSSQQSFIQHQQQPMSSSQSMFAVGGQPRSPAIVGGQLSQALTPGGPPSTGGPPSNNPQTPINPASMNPSSQQAVPTPATPQQAPSSVQSSAAQDASSGPSATVPPDPTSIAKNLIMKDLRHAIFLTPGGPPSTGGPPSNNPQTPINPASMNPSSQQAVPTPATPQQAPSSVQSSAAQDASSGPSATVPPDPTSIAKNLIMKDLRHAIFDLNRAAAELVRPSASRQQLDASVASHNPMSVNPQSANPLSVNPSSVKSLDEPKSVDSADRKSVLSPKEGYNSAMNNFLAVCDQIEINLMLILEAQKQCTRFDKMFTGELKAVGDMANANYSQYALGYLDSTNRLRGAIDRTLHSLSAQIEKVRAAQTRANGRGGVEEEKMETSDGDSEPMSQAHGSMY
ncbi:Mediator of RNA polymerase II transcription subunit 29 [Toxocara canis]|uniref:Mediator of RNA polymerase II transcription subunit 29 n=1 Tax=Toxocara canis TaxID=6265 RepID=A0A0B2USZ9_TOXCA|nr:Mediator of RNA polymerase II transcription subunit 29 [Toxocara canis]